MAKPSVKTKKTSQAPADVRTQPRKGTVSSSAARNQKAARKASSSVSALETGGFWSLLNINLEGLDLSGVMVLDSFVAASNGPSPDVPPAPTSRLYVRSFATQGTASLQRVTYVFPVSPNEVSISRLGITYTELNRPGRKPILKSANKPLQQITVTVMVVNDARDYMSSAQPQMKALESLAEIDYDMEIFYPGVDPAKRWRLTDLSFRTVRRNPDNTVAIAEANITFTEVVTLPAPVPGMPRLKDVPRSRKSGDNPGATSGDQRDTGLDADIAAILAAGPTPQNPGTSGGGSGTTP